MPPHDHDNLSPLLPECPPQKLSIDQILQTWAGEFGCAQLLQCSLVSLAWCLAALLTFIMVFSDQTPQWVCTTPLSGNSSFSIIDGYVGKSRLNLLLSHEMHAQQGSPLCNPSSSICSMDASLWEWSRGNDESTVSQWGLICDQSYKVGLVQCVFFIGAMLGAGIYGSLSDSFLGRRGVLIISCSLSSLLGLLTALSPNYWVYLILRMATGFNTGGMGPTAFILATETVGPSKRGPASMFIFFFYSLGIIMMSTLAFFVVPWRHLYLLGSAPCILYCLIVLPFVNESPRWHLARGRVDDALAILKQIAVRSGRTIPSTITLETEQTNMQDAADDQSQLKSGLEDPGQPISVQARSKATTLDIFRVPTTRLRMMIMLFIWLSNGLLYYGINLDVPNMGGNTSLGLILNAIAEMPAYAITAIMLQKYGRRPVLICVMVVSGLSCLAGTFMGGSTSSTWCGAVAIFGAAASYNLIFMYTAELFPTEVRNAALALTAQAAQVGAIAAPFAAMLGLIHGWLPFSIFCTTAFLGSYLACRLPETLEKPMYETMQGMIRQYIPPVSF